MLRIFVNTKALSTMLGISGGIEPIYDLTYVRKTESLNGEDKYYKVYTPIVKEYIDKHGLRDEKFLPDYFVTAKQIKWQDRLKMQSIVQKHIDQAISSTINLPNKTTVEEIEEIYKQAWKLGLKGVTVYRDGCKRVGILSSKDKKEKEDTTIPFETPINAVGKKRKLITGCGSLHVLAMFSPKSGELCEVYLGKGSTGGCSNYMNGLARMLSLCARSRTPITEILDQLQSTGVCPSYAVATAKKKGTSKGSCCPMAIGNALFEMYAEMQDEIDRGMYEDTLVYDDDDDSMTEEEVIKPEGGVCPECGTTGLVAENGCFSCKNCGYSRCG